MVLATTFGDIVEQIVGSGVGAVVGIFLAEAAWRAARQSLPTALRRTADRLSDGVPPPAQERPAESASVPSVFGPLELEAGEQVTRRVSPARQQVPSSNGSRLPELQIRWPTGEVTSATVPAFGALVIGSGAKAHVRVEGLAPNAAMLQLNGGRVTLAVLDPATSVLVAGQAYAGGEVEFPVGTTVELDRISMRRTF